MKKPAVLVVLYVFLVLPLTASAVSWKSAAARIDITPDYPVRLSGYAGRPAEHEGVVLRIWAKALALQWADDQPAVIITIDSTGIPAVVRAEVLKKLAAAGHMIADERLSIHSSHTHSAPHVRGYLPFIFAGQTTPDEDAHIDRYTREVTEKMVAVSVQALTNLTPARLDWGSGTAAFASNRRLPTKSGFQNAPNPGGPVDHALPVLRVTGEDGGLRAIFTSYACHCTTIGFNKIHGDWAGEAQRELELQFPGAIAMTAIGCGADQNPNPRKTYELARQHGLTLANEAARVLGTGLRPVRGPLVCSARKFPLPLDTLPPRTQWEAQAKNTSIFLAHQGRDAIARLDRGEKLPTTVPFHAQVWSFGTDLMIVNLAGEVVVDYSLRLKKEYDPARTWVNSFTNDVPCYIPSQRVWQEGGYEAAGAMIYYGWPARFASGIEETIMRAVKEMVPTDFAAPPIVK